MLNKSFNTASGKRRCNKRLAMALKDAQRFNTASGKRRCNKL